MRARRAERCFQRAATAIENGSAADAREALDEARILSPTDSRVAHLETRLSEIDQDVASTADELSRPDVNVFGVVAGPTSVEPALLARAVLAEPVAFQPSSDFGHAAGAFEPVIDFDRTATPLEGWSGLALAPPSSKLSRTTGIFAGGLLLFALVGWQTWTHRDLIPMIPTARPDVDARTGLATGPTQLAGVAPSVARETVSQPDIPSQPRPVIDQPESKPSPADAPVALPAAEPEKVETTPADSSPTGTKGTPVITPQQSAQPAASLARETASPATGLSTRQPGSLADMTATENRAPAPSPAAALPTVAAPPAPIPEPQPEPAPPSASASREESVTVAPLSSPRRETELAPSLPSPSSSSTTPSVMFPSRDRSAGVRAALNRYETAYSKLDVAAVQSVWPSLDQHALSRAFDGLASQRVSLGSCSVNVNGNAAKADCSGTAAWTPKVGGGEHITSRKWAFDLAESDGTWHIVRVQAR